MKSKPSKPIVFFACFAVATLCVVLIVKWWQYNQSPERIRDLAIQALRRRDATTLYAITGTDEINDLNLNESKIKRLLDDVKPMGSVGSLNTVEYVDMPVDTRLWALSREHRKGARIQTCIVAIKYEKEGWRLNLTNTLYHEYRIGHGIDGTALYKRNCQSLGVSGIMDQHGTVKKFP